MFHSSKEEEQVPRNIFRCTKVLFLCTGILLGASIQKTDKPVLRVLAIVGMITSFVMVIGEGLGLFQDEEEMEASHDCGCHDHDDFLDVENEIIEDFVQEDFEDELNFF